MAAPFKEGDAEVSTKDAIPTAVFIVRTTKRYQHTCATSALPVMNYALTRLHTVKTLPCAG